MNSNEVFYAMLFGGDWSSNEFNEALINFLKLETGYAESDVVLYVDAVKEYELDELEWLCSERAFDSSEGMVEIKEYVESRTGLSMLQVLMLVNAEEKFHNLLSDAFDRVTFLLSA